jgi:hypothetical protein
MACRRWDSDRRDRSSGSGSRDFDIVIVVVVFGGEGNGECFCWIAGFAPELEVPVGKGAVVGVYGGVFYDDSPVADAGFTPY